MNGVPKQLAGGSLHLDAAGLKLLSQPLSIFDVIESLEEGSRGHCFVKTYIRGESARRMSDK